MRYRFPEKDKRWPLLLIAGALVQQVGWWSLYSELAVGCSLLGGAALVASAIGFDEGMTALQMACATCVEFASSPPTLGL